MERDGGCLCGAVRYRISGEPREVVHCHCGMCQRASGAAFATWACMTREAFAWRAGEPRAFRSSEGVTRTFCGACGSPLTFVRDNGETVDVTLATLDDPDAFRPKINIWTGSRRVWMNGFDRDLPDRRGDE